MTIFQYRHNDNLLESLWSESQRCIKIITVPKLANEPQGESGTLTVTQKR